MEKRWGRAEILGKYAPAKRFGQTFLKFDTWFESRGGNREEGEVKKVKVNIEGGDEIGNSGVTRACLFPI